MVGFVRLHSAAHAPGGNISHATHTRHAHTPLSYRHPSCHSSAYGEVRPETLPKRASPEGEALKSLTSDKLLTRPRTSPPKSLALLPSPPLLCPPCVAPGLPAMSRKLPPCDAPLRWYSWSYPDWTPFSAKRHRDRGVMEPGESRAGELAAEDPPGISGVCVRFETLPSYGRRSMGPC